MSCIPSHRMANGFLGSSLKDWRLKQRNTKYDAIWMTVGNILLRTKALVKRPISQTLFSCRLLLCSGLRKSLSFMYENSCFNTPIFKLLHGHPLHHLHCKKEEKHISSVPGLELLHSEGTVRLFPVFPLQNRLTWFLNPQLWLEQRCILKILIVFPRRIL